MSAIVAKVMNSTVGTSTVKPLDTILKESDAANVEKLNTYMTTIANNAADRLYNKLKSDVRLVGSDEVILRYDGTWSASTNGAYQRTSQGVTFSHNGTVVAKTLQSCPGNTDDVYTFSIAVYKESTSGARYVQSPEVSIPVGQFAEISIAFNVTVGTKYYIEIYSSENDANRNVDFCASFSQFSPTATIASS